MTRNPYEGLPQVPTFTLTSTDVVDGQALAMAQVSGMMGSGGGDVSPQLSWSDFPANTKSFAVTIYDPDAPTASGFWHWAVADIPVVTTSLPAGAGDSNGASCPRARCSCAMTRACAVTWGRRHPRDTALHHYYVAVHAVDVESLGLPEDATPAYLGFNLFMHSVARAVLVGTYEEI